MAKLFFSRVAGLNGSWITLRYIGYSVELPKIKVFGLDRFLSDPLPKLLRNIMKSIERTENRRNRDCYLQVVESWSRIMVPMCWSSSGLWPTHLENLFLSGSFNRCKSTSNHTINIYGSQSLPWLRDYYDELAITPLWSWIQPDSYKDNKPWVTIWKHWVLVSRHRSGHYVTSTLPCKQAKRLALVGNVVVKLPWSSSSLLIGWRTIYLDDVDIKQFKLESYRQRWSVVIFQVYFETERDEKYGR